MCYMYMLCKTGTVCLWVADSHFIFDRIGVCTIRTHMCRLLPSELALALKQVLSFCPIPFLPPLLSGGQMLRNSTSVSTIDPSKHGVVIIKVLVIIVNNMPPPPLCTPHHEPIVGVIYHLFIDIIVETSLVMTLTSYALVCQPGIDHIHRKKRYIETFQPIFSTQLFFDVKTFLAAHIVSINLATCTKIELCCDWMWGGHLNHIGICIWGRVLCHPSHASARPPFNHQSPSKNEVTAVPIHPNKSTKYRLCPVYRPSQKSTHISPVIELYVRQVSHCTLPRCYLDNAKEAESTLPKFFSIRH